MHHQRRSRGVRKVVGAKQVTRKPVRAAVVPPRHLEQVVLLTALGS